MLDVILLSKMVEQKAWDSSLLRKLDKYERVEQSRQIFLRKLDRQ